MLRQNTSNTFMQVLLALVLSSCSLSAFSWGERSITFLQKSGPDTDSYTVIAKPAAGGKCVEMLSRPRVDTVAGGDGQTIKITYLKTKNGCAVRSSEQVFEVRGKQRPDIFGFVMWKKKPGGTPEAIKDEHMDPLGLFEVDNSDSDNVKVWVNYKGESQSDL